MQYSITEPITEVFTIYSGNYWISSAEEIKCSAGGECVNKTLNCADDGSNCEVTCAHSGCMGTTINCLTGYNCTIRTGGLESAKSAIMNGNGAVKLDVFTGTVGEKQLQNAEINCPVGGHCFVDCLGQSQMCEDMRVHGDTANSLWLACNENNNCCHGIDVYCPSVQTASGFCIIDGQASTNGMSDIDIYSQQGFEAVTIYDGVADQNNFGRMHCLNDYAISCAIDTSASAEHRKCAGARTVCDSPTPFPSTGMYIHCTSEPYQHFGDIDPTVQPTTSSPTSYPTSDPSVYPSNNPSNNPTESPFISALTGQSTTQSTEATVIYTITFDIEEVAATESEIEIVIENALIAYADIEIESTTIQDDNGVIVIISSNNAVLTSAIIEKEVEDELEEIYGADINVNVEVNDSSSGNDQNMFSSFLEYEVLLILSLVIVALLLVILIMFILIRRKSKKAKVEFVEPKNEMQLIGSRDNTLTNQKSGESEIIENVGFETPGVVPQDDDYENSLPDEENQNDEMLYKKDNGHVKATSSMTSKGSDIDELYRKASAVTAATTTGGND